MTMTPDDGRKGPTEISAPNADLIDSILGVGAAAQLSEHATMIEVFMNAAREEGKASERPQGAGWFEPPKDEAAHRERLSAEELRLTGTALSEWAWEHLSRGYGVSLTVREISRLIAAVASSERARAEKAEGERDAERIFQADREALADHRPKWGIADAVDNGGRPYQSQFLADALEALRQALSPGKEPSTVEGEGK